MEGASIPQECYARLYCICWAERFCFIEIYYEVINRDRCYPDLFFMTIENLQCALFIVADLEEIHGRE